MMSTLRPSALLATAASLAACASLTTAPPVTSEATGSPNFILTRPAIYKSGDGLMLAGRACRRARATMLSPPRVRLERVSAAGAVIESAHAYLPPIYRPTDQRCSDYSLKVGWAIGPGETVRTCFERGRACPAAPTSAAVVTPAAGPAALSGRP